MTAPVHADLATLGAAVVEAAALRGELRSVSAIDLRARFGAQVVTWAASLGRWRVEGDTSPEAALVALRRRILETT